MVKAAQITRAAPAGALPFLRLLARLCLPHTRQAGSGPQRRRPAAHARGPAAERARCTRACPR